MRKISYYVGALLLASCLCVSCTNEDELIPDGIENAPVSGTIQLDKDTQTEHSVNADGIYKTDGIKFTATGHWRAEVNEICELPMYPTANSSDEVEWLRLSAYKGGPGKHTLTFTLTPNHDTCDRAASIDIISGDKEVSIVVRQKGTKQDGQKPEVEPVKTRFVDNIVTIDNEGGQWKSKHITEFTYNEKGKVTLIALYYDTNQNHLIDIEERANGAYQKTEIIYNESAKTAYARNWEKQAPGYGHEYDIKFNDEGHAVEMDSESNNDGFVETYRFIYKDGYIQSSIATEKGDRSEYYELPEWTNGNLTKVTCGRGSSIFEQSAIEYSNLENKSDVSIDLNFVASVSNAFNNFCEDSSCGLKAIGLFGKRSKNLIAKDNQLATEESSAGWCTYQYETDTNGYVTKILTTEGGDTYSYDSQLLVNYK